MDDLKRIIVPSGSPLRGFYIRNGIPEGEQLVPPDRYLVVGEEVYLGVETSLIATADWGKNGVLYCSNKHRYKVLSKLVEDMKVEA